MEKIPVGTTVAQAYQFAFGGFFRILGVIWLPSAVTLAFNFALVRITETLSATSPSRALLVFVPVYLMSLIFLMIQITGIAELALGRKQGSPYFYFSFAKPVQRVTSAFLLLIVVAIVAALPFVANTLAMIRVSTNPVLGLAVALAFFVLFGAYIYILVRCSFLFIPIAVAEEKVDMRRAWKVAGGNFWRIFVILLVILLPFLTLEMILLFQFMLQGMPLRPPSATPEQIAGYQAAMQSWSVANTARMAKYWYLVYPLYFLSMAIFLGLSVGAQSFAYRAITEDERSAIEAF